MCHTQLYIFHRLHPAKSLRNMLSNMAFSKLNDKHLSLSMKSITLTFQINLADLRFTHDNLALNTD